jgi:hypothetical protein
VLSLVVWVLTAGEIGCTCKSALIPQYQAVLEGERLKNPHPPARKSLNGTPVAPLVRENFVSK